MVEIALLREVLAGLDGSIYLEFSVPRLGKRIDAVLVVGPVLFVIEFKVGEADFTGQALDQVWDYALDLKNFHEPSHRIAIAPVLVATNAQKETPAPRFYDDGVLAPLCTNAQGLRATIDRVLADAAGEAINSGKWEAGSYKPTPTIIEAARALYARHSVADIARSDAEAVNLAKTSSTIGRIIDLCRSKKKKAICFLTGVPGAGKTLVGLNIATQHFDYEKAEHGVFLSGNAPLVAILHEALARDHVKRGAEEGRKVRKGDALRRVEAFIQNVHHFRDEGLADAKAPSEHIALFDEAQRAWNREKTADFMKRRKGKPDFSMSESEFLISCMDRHPDWATVVCLIGGGQEIHTGEAGIGEWIRSLNRAFPHWNVYVSPHLKDSEYEAGQALTALKDRRNVYYDEDLHLAVSMRSFRAESVSAFVKHVLDLELEAARETLPKLSKFPILVTRDLDRAKEWLRTRARGSERFGILASSQAERLKPHAIDIKSPMDPVHWFLDERTDVRSSFYLEDAATEFHVQGLELDWACVSWDADLRHFGDQWAHHSFSGDSWKNIKKPERRQYLKNAYRVLLTRARQGMVIFVPKGDPRDPTRAPAYYNGTFEYLRSIGLPVLA